MYYDPLVSSFLLKNQKTNKNKNTSLIINNVTIGDPDLVPTSSPIGFDSNTDPIC